MVNARPRTVGEVTTVADERSGAPLMAPKETCVDLPEQHKRPPLVVDLDGTLIRSDLLVESFFVSNVLARPLNLNFMLSGRVF